MRPPCLLLGDLCGGLVLEVFGRRWDAIDDLSGSLVPDTDQDNPGPLDADVEPEVERDRSS